MLRTFNVCDCNLSKKVWKHKPRARKFYLTVSQDKNRIWAAELVVSSYYMEKLHRSWKKNNPNSIPLRLTSLIKARRKSANTSANEKCGWTKKNPKLWLKLRRTIWFSKRHESSFFKTWEKTTGVYSEKHETHATNGSKIWAL